MATEWREVSIQDIALHIAMGPFGSNIRTENFVTAGVPVIRGTNLTRGRFRAEDFVFLTPEKADELANSVARPGDLVFTHRGTLGQVGIIPDEPYERYVVSQSQMKLTCDDKSVDPMFLYYYFRSPLGQHALLANTSQTGVPAISRPVTSLRSVRLLLPPMLEQQAISSILSTLDDKIELNRRMGETLDRMAEALFCEWFGSTSFVQKEDNAQQPTRLRDVLTLAYGKGLRKVDRVAGPVPVFGSGGVFDYHNEALIDGPAIIVGRKGTVGSIYWVDEPSFPGDTVFYVESELPLTYCFYLLRTLGLNEMNTDAAVPGLNRENAYRLEVPSPPASLIEQFDSVAAPMRERIRVANGESQTLAMLRDSLLPRLISGELRVPEAEQLVSEVA